MRGRASLVALVAFLALAGCTPAEPWGVIGPDSAADQPTSIDRASCHVEVAVPNMACETACPLKVRALLASVEGVENVDVDFETRSARLRAVWPACGEGGYRRMVDTLATQGYEGVIVSAE